MFSADNSHPTHKGGNIKKTVLAVSLTLGIGSYATQPRAALSTSTLSFTLGTVVTTCNYGTTPPCSKASYAVTDIAGSYFAMDSNTNGPEANEKTPIESNNGIILGVLQAASGSHGGSINGIEVPNIDSPWTFFGGTGMHQTVGTPVTDSTGAGATRTLDFSGWNVTWNGIPNIPVVDQGTTITCDTAACGNNENYTLDGTFHVAGAGFTSVPYFLHLEGKISALNAPPTAVDDIAPGIPNTILGNDVILDVTANDLSGTTPRFTTNTVTTVTPATSGSTVDNNDNTITYTPGPAAGTDTFGYTIANSVGTSNEATVTVDVQTNVAPVATDIPLNTNPTALDNAGGSATVNVLPAVSDANNDPDLPGGVDSTSITIVSDASLGTCTANANGTITYSQTPPSAPVTESCTYQVSDIDTANPPLTSNVASININIIELLSDWPTALDPDVIPILAYDPGVAGDPVDLSVPAKSGSYFTMQVTPSTLLYTVLSPGPDGGLVIESPTAGSGSHTGSPDGTEETGVDNPWIFFSNTGLHYVAGDGITNGGDGTLVFKDVWTVSWNGIERINLGGSSDFPQDLGFALITCSDSPCADGSDFQLNYEAHVQDLPGNPPSGFNGVPYTLHMEGTVRFIDGTLQISNGTVSEFARLHPDDVDSDPDVKHQCVGNCFDYTIDGVTDSRVFLAMALAGGVPNNPVFRIQQDGGVWGTFDTSTGDSVQSAPLPAGATTCPPPGSADYRDITTGDGCLELGVSDNGPNDSNPAVGTIGDASGMGSGGSAGGGTVFVDTRTSSTSGCSISPAAAGPTRPGEWWLIAGFLAWLGWKRRKPQQ